MGILLSTHQLWHGEWKKLPRGHDGWRSACLALAREGITLAVRLVRECVRELKREARERERRRLEAHRMHADVLVRDALWALDQTQLLPRRVDDLRALLVRECFVPHTLGLSIGRPACGGDIVRLLEQVAMDRGGWPLVIQLDNGPESNNGEVRACLRRRGVIVLWNEPRTPEHNPRVERSIGSLNEPVAWTTWPCEVPSARKAMNRSGNPGSWRRAGLPAIG